uniref:hypothetical protein n=1 Tax=Pararhizobium sp. IMCC3301 TaxID=3067904 RepID=UPI002741FB1F|nr:hypothetical protein [Pararhizobium sp. IMCC3301]
MRHIKRIISNILLIEIVLALFLSILLWFVTSVQPNGELSQLGYSASIFFQGLENNFIKFMNTSEASDLGVVPPRSFYEYAVYDGFCGLASFASVYVNNSSALSYFVVIPGFLVIIFAYNKAGPDSFNRLSRIIFSIIVIVMIIIVTFKVIELQDVQSAIVALPSQDYLAEEYNYRCDAQISEFDGESSVAELALFLGNLSAFLSEIRLYLLGLLLWIIGREHADIRRMQRTAINPSQQVEGDGNVLG